MRPRRRRTRARCRGAALGLAALALACGDPAPPNVLLISVDTLRADAVGVYGGPVPTPAMDGLARDGVRVAEAIAPSSQTTPSHASLFTGQDVLHHGALRNGVALPDEAHTLAEAFRDAGYATAGFASSFVLDRRFGWDQGFEVWDAEFSADEASVRHPGGLRRRFDFEGFDRSAAQTNRAALSWLAGAREPFFLFVHYFDPHAPYGGTPELHARVPRTWAMDAADARIADLQQAMPGISRAQLAVAIRNYQAEVLAVDAAIGALLAALDERGVAERTLVVLTADHGEGLGQHGTLDHAPNLYEEQLRVPLVLRWPGRLAAGRVVTGTAGLIDLAPTIAELAGVEFSGDTDGRSLADALRGGRAIGERALIGRRRRYERSFQGHRGEKSFVRSGGWKYIRASADPDELYDLGADPDERVNRIADQPDRAARLGAILDAAIGRYPDRSAPVEPDPEARRGLEALGYAE